MKRQPEVTFPIGATVRHRRSGVEGVVVGRPVAARSAGGVLMQRVRWVTVFRQHPDGSAAFVRDLELVAS